MTYRPFILGIRILFMQLIKFENINLYSILRAAVGLGAIIVFLEIINKIENPEPDYPVLFFRPSREPRKDFTKTTKEDTLRRQGFRCNSCGDYSNYFDFHHKDGNKGNNYSSNCEALCPNCHAEKTRKN